MKYSEFRNWLIRQGAVIKPGKGSHQKVTLDGRSSILPYHGSKEIGTGLVRRIRKDLGLED